MIAAYPLDWHQTQSFFTHRNASNKRAPTRLQKTNQTINSGTPLAIWVMREHRKECESRRLGATVGLPVI